ncbi:MAG TPA: hypothetical protein VGI00_24540, partial [Streptosporangiaceae bacterium]
MVSLTAVAVLGVGLAACSSSGSSGSSGKSSSGSSSSAGLSKKNLELVVGTKSDDFYVTMECGADRRQGARPRVAADPDRGHQ